MDTLQPHGAHGERSVGLGTVSAPVFGTHPAPHPRAVRLSTGAEYPCETNDLSMGGAAVSADDECRYTHRIVNTAEISLRFKSDVSPNAGVLAIAVNGIDVPARELPVSLPDGSYRQRFQIATELLGERNQLTVRLKNDAGREVQVFLQQGSSVELDESRVHLADDLSILPLPFVDPESGARRIVHFVFATPPDGAILQAAAVVSSWLAMHSPSPLPRIAVSIGEIPKGNAIIFAARDWTPLSSFGVGKAGGGIAMRANPQDPYGKLVFVYGADESQMLAAAQALADPSFDKRGPETGTATYTPPAPRKQDETISVMQPLQMRQFFSSTNDSSHVAMPFTLAPDLYLHDQRYVRFNIHVALGAAAAGQPAELSVILNGIDLGSMRVPQRMSAIVLDRQIRVASSNLKANNRFDLYFTSPANGVGHPSPVISSATLRLQEESLPRLRVSDMDAFANSGYPFTRYPDLAHTAVLIDAHAGADELGLMLTTLAWLGAESGYPAYHVTVLACGDICGTPHTDILRFEQQAPGDGAQPRESTSASAGGRTVVTFSAAAEREFAAMAEMIADPAARKTYASRQPPTALWTRTNLAGLSATQRLRRFFFLFPFAAALALPLMALLIALCVHPALERRASRRLADLQAA